MKLYTYCSNCKAEINFSASVKKRSDLTKKFETQNSNSIILSCNCCKTQSINTIDSIKAEVNQKIIGFSTIFFAIAAIILSVYIFTLAVKFLNIYTVGGLVSVISIPYLICHAIKNYLQNKVMDFNFS
ncbi:hypothetical protein HGP29_09610 [Flammeovirga sp. SR4]|uniref:Uncharacterized protein n=1 Tax=Flammeovirga agarivorans TaxID=2726742 RepID=A0A7X8SJV5_9BACT|nr:hypothetical protein [Flammeovirga agarivorans]